MAILLLAVHPALARLRQSNPVFFDAVLTIAGTFTGVIGGLYYSGLNDHVSELGQVRNLLLTMDTDLDLIGRYAESFQVVMQDPQRYERVRFDPLPEPELVGTLLSSELVIRNISPQSFAGLTTVKIDTARLANNVNTGSIPWVSLQPHLKSYSQVLKYGRDVIKHELQFLKGEISHAQLCDDLIKLIRSRQENAPPELKPGMSIR